MFDIVTVGHFSIDFIKIPGKRLTKPTLGGPPTYVSLAARKLGAKVSVISKVGQDFSPNYMEWLKKRCVDLSALQKFEDALTTSFVLNYRRNGERQLILKNRGPQIEAEDIPDSFKAKVIHIAPIANEISYEAVLRLQGLASLVSLDPQGFLRRFKENGEMYLERTEISEILRRIDVFKASQREIEAVTGESDLTEAIRRVCECGVKIVIVTRGIKGVLLYVKGKLYWVPSSKPRAVVDTTGAGDVFMGAFLAEYIQDKNPLWSASVGSASASFTVEKLGPRRFGSEKEVYERAVQVYEKAFVVEKV